MIWEHVEHVRKGQCVARAMVLGSEIHFMVEPEHRRKLWPRRLAREFLAPLFERCGYLTTRCRVVDDATASRFVQRLGFKRTWCDGVYDYYMLDTLPFSRSH